MYVFFDRPVKVHSTWYKIYNNQNIIFFEQRVKNRNCVHFRMFRLLKPNILLYVAPVDSIEPTNELLFWTEKIWSKNSNLQISDDFGSLLFNCRLNRFELAAFAWYTFQLIRCFFFTQNIFWKIENKSVQCIFQSLAAPFFRCLVCQNKFELNIVEQ